MKWIRITIFLFLLPACSLVGANNVVLKDSITGKNLNNSCSSDEENKAVYQSIQGQCDHIPKSSPLHHVNRQVINGEVCCVVEVYVDYGNGKITPIGR